MMRRIGLVLLALLVATAADASVYRYNYRVHSTTGSSSARIPQFIIVDTDAELPATDVGEGDVAYSKDTDKVWTYDGATWNAVSGGGGGGAPTTAKYMTQTPDAGLSAEQAWSLLASGLVLNTTATGVASIYGGTSCSATNWINALSASGAGTCAQPAFSDVSGSVTDPQVPDNITILLAAAASALAADPADCANATHFAVGVTAAGVATCEAIGTADVPTLNQNTTGTAAALAANGTNCSAGQYARGVDASGNAENCTVDAGTTPTGTGFPHVTAGVQDAAAKLVDTADVNANQVTFAKWQTISGGQVVGRESIGAGDATALGLTNLTISGGNLIASTDAPIAAEYIVSEANGTLSAEVAPSAANQVPVSSSSTAAAWGTVPDAALTNNYSGVGTCTNQFARVLNDNAAPTCATVALGTDTSGNYVASVATGLGLAGGLGGSAGAVITVTQDYSQTLAGNPATNAEECMFTTDGAGAGGFLCEGTAADTSEQLWLFPSITGAGADTTQYLGNFVLVQSGTVSDAVIANYTALTGISFTPVASGRYLMDCLIRYTSTAATTGISLAWDVPTGATISMTGTTVTVSATNVMEGFWQRADNVGGITTASVITVENVAALHAQLVNGANATATTLGITPETANSVSAIAGSTCTITQY